MVVKATVGPGLKRAWLAFSHDASSLSPLLGSPTSVLAYDPFAVATTDFSFSASSAPDRYVDLNLSSAVWGSGDFADSDYSAGQTLTSLTFSHASIASDIALEGRAGIPGFAPVFGPAQVTAFAAARLQASRYALTGLTCAKGCIVPAGIGPSSLIMQHDLTDAAIGAGLKADFVLLGGQSSFEMQADLGRASLADSHFLRRDLGPTPNILSDFSTFRVTARFAHEQPITRNLGVALSIDGSVQTGWGETVFAANSTSALAPVSSTFTRSSIGGRIGIVGHFP